MLIEEHVEFEKIEKSGATRTVRLASAFLSTFRNLHPSKLPVVVAVSTCAVCITDLRQSGCGRWS